MLRLGSSLINKLHQVHGVRFTVDFAWRALSSDADGGVYRLGHTTRNCVGFLRYSVCGDLRKLIQCNINEFMGNHVDWLDIYIIHNTIQYRHHNKNNNTLTSLK